LEITKRERVCRGYLLRLSKPVRKSAYWEYHKVSFLRGLGDQLISGGEGEREQKCSLALPCLPLLSSQIAAYIFAPQGDG